MKRRRESSGSGILPASTSPVLRLQHAKRFKTTSQCTEVKGEENLERLDAPHLQEPHQGECLVVGQLAPHFVAEAVFGDGSFGKVDLEQFKGTFNNTMKYMRWNPFFFLVKSVGSQ